MTEHNPEESRPHDQERAEAAFVEAMAGPLRAPESLDATFEQRLMSAVHAEVRARQSANASSSWWRRGRTITLSPFGVIAMAAGVVAMLAAGAAADRLLQRRETSRPVSVSRADTVQVVRFVFVDSAARSVAIIGDFNGWTKGATPLLPAGQRGAWVVSVPLTLGRHEYAFIVDGTRWVADPFAPSMSDDFGTESSIVTLGRSQS